jgi:hypothetical protein
VNSPEADLDGDHALHAAVLDHQIDAEMLVEALDRRVLDRGLEQRVQHVEAGLVGGEPGALDLHAAEGAHVDMAVGRAAPRAAPVFELGHLFVAVGDEVLDHVLLAQPVAATDGVVEVILEAVASDSLTPPAAFGGDRVAAHRDRPSRPARSSGRGSDSPRRSLRAARAAAADDHYICLVISTLILSRAAIAGHGQHLGSPSGARSWRGRLIMHASACRACLPFRRS